MRHRRNHPGQVRRAARARDDHVETLALGALGKGCHPVGRAVCRDDPRLVRHVEFLEQRSEEHTSELQSLMRISYAVFCLKKKKKHHNTITHYYNSITLI